MKFIPAFLITALVVFSSCETGDLEAEIPSYFAIDEVIVEEDASKGTNSHKITDVWVTMDSQFLGAYEVPCKFPILDDGEHVFKVTPGIKLNGIAGTRAQYIFYEPCILQLDGEDTEENKVTLTRDQAVHLTAKTKYKENSNVALNEDFESAGSFFTSIEKKDETIPLLSTELGKTSDPSQVFEGSASGIITLQGDTNYVELLSITPIVVPKKDDWSILELNYKSDIAFTVGIDIENPIEKFRLPSLTINPKDEWNKIYIHTSPQVGAPSNVSVYRIYLTAYKPSDVESGTILLDNIKFIHE